MSMGNASRHFNIAAMELAAACYYGQADLLN